MMSFPNHFLFHQRLSYNYCNSNGCLDGTGATPCHDDGRCQCIMDAALTSGAKNVKVSGMDCAFQRYQSSGPACSGETVSVQCTLLFAWTAFAIY